MSGEIKVVRGALVWGAAAMAPLAGLAYLIRGQDGAVSAALALGLVLANAGLSALISAVAGRLTPSAPMMISLPSFGVRMALIAAVLIAVQGRSFMDEPVFAATFGLSILFVIVAEATTWRRTPWIALTFSPEES